MQHKNSARCPVWNHIISQSASPISGLPHDRSHWRPQAVYRSQTGADHCLKDRAFLPWQYTSACFHPETSSSLWIFWNSCPDIDCPVSDAFHESISESVPGSLRAGSGFPATQDSPAFSAFNNSRHIRDAGKDRTLWRYWCWFRSLWASQEVPVFSCTSSRRADSSQWQNQKTPFPGIFLRVFYLWTVFHINQRTPCLRMIGEVFHRRSVTVFAGMGTAHIGAYRMIRPWQIEFHHNTLNCNFLTLHLTHILQPCYRKYKLYKRI